MICDMAQTLIRKWQEKKNWTFEAYPERVGLPVGLFQALPSHEAAQEVAQTQYLPDGFDERLDTLVKSMDRKKVRYCPRPLC